LHDFGEGEWVYCQECWEKFEEDIKKLRIKLFQAETKLKEAGITVEEHTQNAIINDALRIRHNPDNNPDNLSGKEKP
jgi:hypothetical protein